MDNITKDNIKEEDTSMEDGADGVVAQDDLASFREQWKKELGNKPVSSQEKESQRRELLEDDEEDQEDDIHVKARQFFLQGVKYEESGKLYEAIRFYKKAEK